MTTSEARAAASSPDTASDGSGSDPSSGTARVTPPSLLRNGAYLALMTGLTARSFGMSITLFAVPLIAFAITGDVLSSGVISGVGATGALLATLPAGVVADRVDRRTLIAIAGFVAGGLWLTAAGALAVDSLRPWHLTLVLLCSSVAATVIGPAGDGGLKSAVSATQLPTARAAVEGREAAAGLIGGPVGGVLYAIAHALPLFAAALGNLVAAVAALFIRTPLNGDIAEARAQRPVAALLEGLRYVASRRLFVVTIALAIILNTASNGAIMAITLDLARRGTEPLLIGLLSAVIGASLLMGAFLAPWLVRRVKAGRIVPAGLLLIAVGFTAAAIRPTYAVFLAGVGAGFLLAPALNAALLGYASVITPEQLQGRFSSIIALAGTAAAPLAPLVGAGLLAVVGLGTTLAILAAVLIAVAVSLALYRPLRRIGTPETWEADALR